jgi:hypothetical protein
MPPRPRTGIPATRVRGRRQAAVTGLAGLVLVLAVGGCAERPPWPAGPGAQTPAPGPAVPATAPPPAPAPSGDPAGPRAGVDVPAVPPRAPGFEVGELPGQVTVPGPALPPVGLAIPVIGVATRLVNLGLEADGTMAVPEDFGRAGWFAEGPTPGQVGPAVIAGHVDSKRGPAVFYRLRDLRPGDAVLVERADGSRLRFLVEQARSYPKAGFPTAAVFGPATAAVLRLVTCTGDFDRARGSYRDNLVVFARLAGVAR